MAQRTIRVRRVYDEPDGHDGTRVLVDRVWPRGVRKDDLDMDEWLKDVAPSAELRKWFGHDPDKFTEFRRRYRAELHHADARETMRRLRSIAADEPLTQRTAPRDVDHSQVSVLADLLR